MMGSSWDFALEEMKKERQGLSLRVKIKNRVDPGDVDTTESSIEYHLNQLEYHVDKLKKLLTST